MGKKIVLTGVTLTDTTAPRLVTVDPIESAGSLLLIEPSHPAGAWDTGIPATVPNLLADALATGASCAVTVGGAINNGTKGLLERSGKGGLHAIVSQANALASGDGVRITPPGALVTYLGANPTHDYYMSIWDRLTRANTGAGENAECFWAMCSSWSFFEGLGSARSWYWNGNVNLGFDDAGNVVGPRFAAKGVDAYTSGETAAYALLAGGAPAGTINDGQLATFNSHWSSFVFYRTYIEDLTVSGRTYAEVSALDQALYTQHVLTAGGRYYGDTFTDPATVP